MAPSLSMTRQEMINRRDRGVIGKSQEEGGHMVWEQEEHRTGSLA